MKLVLLIFFKSIWKLIFILLLFYSFNTELQSQPLFLNVVTLKEISWHVQMPSVLFSLACEAAGISYSQ